ncbi:hypothetical protein GYMLUDRAFT_243801 [Collybiopsis luxurians FD-317 M1]|uniref:Uncharacterized protein n=1 Tax=Collybiopsis luxurians FD-317 M1 TaxID=944289 RepID=A0A0D0CXW7_9AGAR|nr:hypothetical protein GYMLUDRAFT_243801 [Collybiopsis luxurians FD-317 M1]
MSPSKQQGKKRIPSPQSNDSSDSDENRDHSSDSESPQPPSPKPKSRKRVASFSASRPKRLKLHPTKSDHQLAAEAEAALIYPSLHPNDPLPHVWDELLIGIRAIMLDCLSISKSPWGPVKDGSDRDWDTVFRLSLPRCSECVRADVPCLISSHQVQCDCCRAHASAKRKCDVSDVIRYRQVHLRAKLPPTLVRPLAERFQAHLGRFSLVDAKFWTSYLCSISRTSMNSGSTPASFPTSPTASSSHHTATVAGSTLRVTRRSSAVPGPPKHSFPVGFRYGPPRGAIPQKSAVPHISSAKSTRVKDFKKQTDPAAPNQPARSSPKETSLPVQSNPSPRSPSPLDPSQESTVPIPIHLPSIPADTQSLDVWKEGYGKLMKEWAKVHGDLRQNREVINEMDQELQRLREELRGVRSELSVSHEEIGRLTKQLADTQNLTSTQQTLLDTQRSDLVELETLRRQVSATEQIRIQHQKFEERFGSINFLYHYSQLSNRIEGLERENRLLTISRNDLQNRLREQEELVGLRGEGLTSLQQAHQQLQSEKSRLLTQLGLLEESVALLRSEGSSSVTEKRLHEALMARDGQYFKALHEVAVLSDFIQDLRRLDVPMFLHLFFAQFSGGLHQARAAVEAVIATDLPLLVAEPIQYLQNLLDGLVQRTSALFLQSSYVATQIQYSNRAAQDQALPIVQRRQTQRRSVLPMLSESVPLSPFSSIPTSTALLSSPYPPSIESNRSRQLDTPYPPAMPVASEAGMISFLNHVEEVVRGLRSSFVHHHQPVVGSYSKQKPEQARRNSPEPHSQPEAKSTKCRHCGTLDSQAPSTSRSDTRYLTRLSTDG